ncbi:MAG: FapA family protein [Planctomycetota bacterium]|jgi:hypothetical protein
MSQHIEGRVAITVAEDWMTAWGEVRDDIAAKPLEADQVHKALIAAGVMINDDVRARVNEFVRRVHERGRLPGPYALAQGLSADDVVHEVLCWHPRYQSVIDRWQAGAAPDVYALNSIVTVEPDSLIGTVTTDRPAVVTNIRGETLPGTPRIAPLEIDETTIRRGNDSPATLTALSAGRLVDTGRRLRLEPVLHVDDVSFKAGTIDSSVSIAVTGRVPDGCTLKSRRSISIGLDVGSADLAAGRGIMVRQGIAGRHEGLVEAHGTVACRYATDAHIVVQRGDLRVTQQLMNTYGCVGGSLIARQGAMVGGCVFARNGAELKTIGSNAGVPTRLVVGVQPETLREIAEINRGIKNGSLQLTRVRQRRKDLYEMAHVDCNPRILISGTIHPNVTLRLVDRVVEFPKFLRGPVSIEKRKIDGVTQVVAVNKVNASVKTLKSHRHDADDLLDGFMLEGDEALTRAA